MKKKHRFCIPMYLEDGSGFPPMVRLFVDVEAEAPDGAQAYLEKALQEVVDENTGKNKLAQSVESPVWMVSRVQPSPGPSDRFLVTTLVPADYPQGHPDRNRRYAAKFQSSPTRLWSISNILCWDGVPSRGVLVATFELARSGPESGTPPEVGEKFCVLGPWGFSGY